MSIVYAVHDLLKDTDQLSPFTLPINFSEFVERKGTQCHRFSLFEVTLPSWMSAPNFFSNWSEAYWYFLQYGCEPEWDEDVWDGLRRVHKHNIDMFLAALYLLRTKVRKQNRKEAKHWLENWLSTRPTIVPSDWLPPLDWWDLYELKCIERMRLRHVYPPLHYIRLDAPSGKVNCDELLSAMNAAMCLADFDGEIGETENADLDILAIMG